VHDIGHTGELRARTLKVEITSSGFVAVSGSVDRQSLKSSSSGAYRAEGLESREASLDLSGSGSAAISVSGELSATISSSGSIRYRGDPSKLSVNASSSGKLVKLE